jgi:arylsulfatase A-like enzyme
MRSYSALITGADANIGRIVKRLEELGLRENTLVIFTADQGWNAGHHGVWGKGNGTVPFNMYEESLRVPLIWNHPGRIPAGSTTRALVSSYDYFPTILDYLNVPSPVQTMGRSCKSVLAQPKANWTRNRLFFEYAYVRGIRTENLKYIERAAPYGSELYDLEADPGETVNRIDDPAYRKQRDALARELAAYFAKQGAPPLAEWKSTTRQKLFEYRK